MKLFIADKNTDKENVILLGRPETDFSEWLNGKAESDYVRDRIDSDKEVIELNRFDRLVVIRILKSSDKPLHRKREEARMAAYALHPRLKEYDLEEVIIANAGVFCEETVAFAEGLALTNYQFLKYFSDRDKKAHRLNRIGLRSEKVDEEILNRLSSTVEAVCHSRDLVNEPLSYLTAEKLAEEVTAMGREAGFTVEVFNKKKIESLRMGGILAVNRGSIDPPTFSILEWKPENAVNEKPVVIVGKGVVYDTGGMSLKPTHDSMDYMKCDMAGAATVAGTFYAAAKAKLPVWVIGLIPATDNRPDGNAYVPGDIVKMYDGKTVEVLNTDAEGRMILADALSWAKQYDPELVVELSTLTGSAHVALGKYGIAGMGNAPGDMMEALKLSGDNTYERIAEFPFWEEYGEMMKSDIADLKNIGGRLAGAITAGKFLENFTDYPFIHLDIAGPAFNKTEDNYRGKGGSGIGVRLLADFLYHFSR